MEYRRTTPLDGRIILSTDFGTSPRLLAESGLYKFIWVTQGEVLLEVDHVVMHLHENEIVSLTPLHHAVLQSAEGEYVSLLFDSNFYCIFGHDSEVSCNGFLFHGSSNVMRLHPTEQQSHGLRQILDDLSEEFTQEDDLQEETLRISLKRFIIACTRIAREKLAVTPDREMSFDIIRQFYVLVDTHYKTKKQVSEYADLLFRSPKTLSHLFSEYGLPSPLKVIHERVTAEARRLLLYTSMSAKEIGDILGFEDAAVFSRFFKKMTQRSISDFRKTPNREELPTSSAK